MDTSQQRYDDPLLTPLVIRHRMSNNNQYDTIAMPNTMTSRFPSCDHNTQQQQQQRQSYENNNGGVVTLLSNGHSNTVRWSCQSYESGITESSFNSYNQNNIGGSGGEVSRVNVQEMLDRGFEETEVLRRWLDSFGLLCYFDCFLLAGYDSLSIMSRMTTEDLTAIGITEPNHRRMLRSELGKLRFADNYAETVTDNLFEFLTQLGLEHYTGALSRTGCDTTAKLLQLELDDLEDVGVAKLGHQKRLYLAVKHYNGKNRRNSSRLSSISTCSSNKMPFFNESSSNSAARPPINHFSHRSSAPILRNQSSVSQTSPAAVIVGKVRPTSITKQLSTFQEPPRSPNVIMSNSSSAAVAPNFIQNGGLDQKRNGGSPYGFIGADHQQKQEQQQQQQDFVIYSTGSIKSNNSAQNNNNNNRHSFNYAPLRFTLKNSPSTSSHSNVTAAESPTSRSVHSGPPQQQQQFAAYQHSMSQPSPTHSLNRLSLNGNSSHHGGMPLSPSFQHQQQQQRAHSIYSSTPPPPPSSAAQLQYSSENYAVSSANGHQYAYNATLPRSSGGRHSALSFFGSNTYASNNKKSPQNSGRMCDTIGEPLSGENEPLDQHYSSMQPYCRAASFENHLHEEHPKPIHQRRMSGHSAGGSGTAPPPPPPRALQTTLDFHQNAPAEFPPPPSPLAVAPLPMMLSLQSNVMPSSMSDSRSCAAASPATLMMPRKQPQQQQQQLQIPTVQSLYSNDVSRDFRSATGPQQPHSYVAAARAATTLHDLLGMNARVSASNVASGSSSNSKTFHNISPDLAPNGASSISTGDSGNSSASSVDEEHDARTHAGQLLTNTATPSNAALALQQQPLYKTIAEEREPEDVLNEISGMLANLTDELDNMLQY